MKQTLEDCNGTTQQAFPPPQTGLFKSPRANSQQSGSQAMQERKDKFHRRLIGIFLAEMEDRLATFNRNLMALERGPRWSERQERLRRLHYTVQQLRKSAQAAALPAIERCCRALEGLLSAAENHHSPLDAELFRLLFAAAEGLAEACGRMRTGRNPADTPLVELMPQLEAAAASHAKRPDRQRTPNAVDTVPRKVRQTPAQ